MLFPCGNLSIVLDLFQAAEHRLAGQVVKFFAAEVIATSLHVADAELAVAFAEQRFFKKGDVFVEELFLQVLRPCRNDDAFAGADHRQQISERLSGASSGFDDQVAAFFDGLFDRLCHLKLSTAELVGWVRLREHASGCEELVQGGERLWCCGCGGLRGGRHRVSIINATLTSAPAMWGRAPSPVRSSNARQSVPTCKPLPL